VGLVNGLVLLAGLYLILSPWVVQSMIHVGLVASNEITGLTLLLLAVAYTRSFDRLRAISWVVPVIGAWVIVAPWMVSRGYGLMPAGLEPMPPMSVSTWLNNVIVGAIVVAAGAGLTALAARIRSDNGAWRE